MTADPRSQESLADVVVHITTSGVAFAVLTAEGFGQVVVELAPGQQETVRIHGRRVTVVRDYLM